MNLCQVLVLGGGCLRSIAQRIGNLVGRASLSLSLSLIGQDLSRGGQAERDALARGSDPQVSRQTKAAFPCGAARDQTMGARPGLSGEDRGTPLGPPLRHASVGSPVIAGSARAHMPPVAAVAAVSVRPAASGPTDEEVAATVLGFFRFLVQRRCQATRSPAAKSSTSVSGSSIIAASAAFMSPVPRQSTIPLDPGQTARLQRRPSM